MASHEYSSARLGEIAARRLHDPDPEVAALAGSVLTQLRDRQPKSYLTELLLSRGPFAPGALAGVQNRLAGPALGEFETVTADSVLAQYGKRTVR